MSTVETYDREREHWRFLRDAYLGGRCWKEPSATTIGNARLSWNSITEDGTKTPRVGVFSSYLVPHDGETDAQFTARCSLSAYVNIVSPVVKAYAEGCTANVQRNLSAVEAFTSDVDRRGSNWDEFVGTIATWSSVYGMLATVVDAPNVSVDGMSEAQRAAAKIAPYVVTVHPSAWVRVECDDTGRLLLFAYVDKPYRSAASASGETVVSVRAWRARTENHPGGWSVHEMKVAGSTLISEYGIDDSTIVADQSGPLPAACDGEIPVTFCFYERDPSFVCPQAQSLIADVADIGRQIYNCLSWCTEILRKAGFPFLAVPLKSTGGQLDAGTAMQIGVNSALGYDSGSGAPQWIQPSAESSRELRDNCVYLFQWAMRMVGLELAADASAQVQSGEALRIRSRDFESRAQKFARNLQRWEMSTLKLLARMGGVGDPSPDMLSVEYAKRITLPDPSEEVALATQLLGLPVEIGPEARVEAVKQVIRASLQVSDEQLASISEALKAMYEGDVNAFAARQTLEMTKAKAETAMLAPVDPQDVAAGASNVADTALNGAQIASLLEVLGGVSSKTIPAESADAVIASAFPTISPEKRAAMLDPLKTFSPPVTNAPA